ncbi:hypothetical protein PRCB_02410 [Pantoea rodasii]|uniref:Uncharacterized protein n=1 Tax=Pantoea rodasii TaxID=1076549 RepID=A0A2M9WHU5_9GAMM|nr:hypothetical protein HA45_22670 [Pantoea rodasii]PJZ07135.1 hypothetical protein PRCB_02410 [Pantoea rodasii]
MIIILQLIQRLKNLNAWEMLWSGYSISGTKPHLQLYFLQLSVVDIKESDMIFLLQILIIVFFLLGVIF